MNNKEARKRANAFLKDYRDPGVKKTLWYDVWADRNRLTDVEKRRVWGEVIRITRSRSALLAAARRGPEAPRMS